MTRRGTTMSRWKVRKFRNDFFSPGRCEWVAWPEGGWAECQAFPTHAEALAYADRKARTREVVLPGPDWLTRHGVRLDVDRYRTSAKANSLKYGIYIDIPTQDLRPLALALLAHAERMSK